MRTTGWYIAAARGRRRPFATRLVECRLELHPTKTKVVYSKDDRRRGNYETVSFDFLGYCFRPRSVKAAASQKLFCGFTPAVRKSALNAMRSTIRDLNIHTRTEVTLDDIAQLRFDRLNRLHYAFKTLAYTMINLRHYC
jgi:RNA-directed DNA polymerase